MFINMELYTKSAWWVVARNFWGQVQIIMLRDLKYNDWTRPKWHIEEWETLHEACIREVYEEAWLTWVVIHKLLKEVVRKVRGTDEIKTVYYYLMTLKDSLIKFDTTQDNSTFEVKRIDIDNLPPFYLEEQEKLVRENVEVIKNACS